jgi:arylsulfatase A-like enzyme
MRKPNVIFILADDMGYGDFSAFNPELKGTPALDRLVAQGVTLANCHASSPVCAPARASIITGRYPQRCGVIDTLEARGLDRLNLSETTIGNIFQQNGYSTALIGKWHLGAIDSAYHPNNRGFDHFVGFRGGWNYYYDYSYERNTQRIVGDGTYMTDLLSDEAISYIRSHASEPFFMHLA